MKFIHYPPSPKLENTDFLKPTASFMKIAVSVVLSIIMFFLFYLLLVALGAGILVGSVYAGLGMMSVRIMWFTVVAGIGIMALGLMFFIFLVKFIFARSKDENPYRMQIHESEHPELFSFIKQLSLDTKTKFPKKIFISPDVNAKVFYNSSFWSLFFPVRKNLEIGLGLINTLTISELKGVIAHEFGHFSQRSMKLGSYIYTVNRAIYNLVYTHDSWDNWLAQWASAGGLFGIFASLTFWMVERVRDLLKVAHNLININYMKLSREMEYHADLVAISVSGNEPFKNALRKIEFGGIAYGLTTGHLEKLANHNLASKNLYHNHIDSLAFLAEKNNIPYHNHQLTLSDEDIKDHIVKTRVNYKDQWASHPTLEEREASIARVNIQTETAEESAWQLFREPVSLQETVTKKLYEIGFNNTDFEEITNKEYKAYMTSEADIYTLADAYNGYYDGRMFSKFNPADTNALPVAYSTFEEAYAQENIDLIKSLIANKTDLETLTLINDKNISAKHFEFDGIQYKRKQAKPLIQRLEKEVQEQEQQLLKQDQKVFGYHLLMAKIKEKEGSLISAYRKYTGYVTSMNELDGYAYRIGSLNQRLYSKMNWTEDEIKIVATDIAGIEKEFKLYISDDSLKEISQYIDVAKDQEYLENYIHSDTYLNRSYAFSHEHFQAFINLFNLVHSAASVATSKQLKTLTDFQLTLERSAQYVTE